MHKDRVTALALSNGFKLKEQPDGTQALNPYVYDFAVALLKDKDAEMAALRQVIETLLPFAEDAQDEGCWSDALNKAVTAAHKAMAQAVQPARVVRAAIGESKPLTAEQYASIRQP